MNKSKRKILWEPHKGTQTEALRRTEFEILYGGARGGGKTAAGIAWLLKEIHRPETRCLVLRKNSTDLEDWIDRANRMYSKLLFKKSGNPPRFEAPSGAIIRTGHLQDQNAYTKYQGHEYQRILIEELTQIPREKDYLRILSSCRSTVEGLEPRIFATTNPGGAGHLWVKERFIDVAEWGTPYKTTINVNGKEISRSRIFIHATIDDNPTLMETDPGYVYNLEVLKDKDPQTYKAWRYGDWDVFQGQVYGEFDRNDHVIKPLIPSRNFTHMLCIDWGYSKSSAFAGYLFAILNSKTSDGDKFNRVIIYKEFYGNQKTPDTWADIISEFIRENNIKLSRIITDPAMHNSKQDSSISIADIMRKRFLDNDIRVRVSKGNNNRIANVARLHNWLAKGPDGLPYLLITNNCINWIRTIPMLVYDENRVEDVDTDQEDHAFDSTVYGLSRVKYIGVKSGGLGGSVSTTLLKGSNFKENKDGEINEIAPDFSDFSDYKKKSSTDWRTY